MNQLCRNLKFKIFLICTLLLVSCATLPKIYQIQQPVKNSFKKNSSSLFPKGNFQFVHTIEAVMQGGYKGTFMGVCDISSLTGSIRCIIMTIEGFVLFDAQLFNDKLTIKRGIKPFDSKAFALGLMRDIQFIFFKPIGKLLKTGISENNLPVYRYKSDTKFTDIIIFNSQSYKTTEYNKNYNLLRSVKIEGTKNEKYDFIVPNKIKLKIHTTPKYTLDMNLIQMEEDNR